MFCRIYNWLRCYGTSCTGGTCVVHAWDKFCLQTALVAINIDATNFLLLHLPWCTLRNSPRDDQSASTKCLSPQLTWWHDNLLPEKKDLFRKNWILKRKKSAITLRHRKRVALVRVIFARHLNGSTNEIAPKFDPRTPRTFFPGTSSAHILNLTPKKNSSTVLDFNRYRLSKTVNP